MKAGSFERKLDRITRESIDASVAAVAQGLEERFGAPTDPQVADAIAILTKWLDDQPVYVGDDPRAVHYRRNRRALSMAIKALSAQVRT